MSGKVYFTANDAVHGQELWKSNGTNAGTVLVKDITPGAYGSFILHASTAEGGQLFFFANDNIHGEELWKSNGTNAGTVLVKDINPGDYHYGDLTPSHLTAVGGRLFFTANDGVHGHELWKTSGSSSGTAMVKDIWPHHHQRPLHTLLSPLWAARCSSSPTTASTA